MIDLYGFPISNFYNKVKLALLEKEIPFNEKRIAPTTNDPEYLKKVPTGKIPWLIHNDTVIFESTVMLEYLEEAFPDTRPLLPKSPVDRAKVRTIISIIDLHIDPSARKIYGLLKNQTIDPEIKKAALTEIEFALQALKQLVRFSPFIAGDTYSMADCSAIATLHLVNGLYQKLGIENKLEKINGYKEYLELISSRDSTKKVLRSVKAARRGLGYK